MFLQTRFSLKVAVPWLGVLFRNPEVLASNLGPKPSILTDILWISSVPPEKYRDSDVSEIKP